MANFLGIVNWCLRIEDASLSGVVVNLMDGGGRTRYGIAEFSNPNMPADFYTVPAAQALPMAEAQYRTQYWNRFMGDQITDDGVASCLLSFGINDGTAREVKMLQGILGIPQDGIFGPETLAKTNAALPQTTAYRLRQAQAAFYQACVAAQPTDARFLAGWLRRANLIYPNL